MKNSKRKSSNLQWIITDIHRSRGSAKSGQDRKSETTEKNSEVSKTSEPRQASQKPPITSRIPLAETPKGPQKRNDRSLDAQRSTPAPIETELPPWMERKMKTYSITPKPTEVTFPLPKIDPPSTKNSKGYITRHHLDDSQAYLFSTLS